MAEIPAPVEEALFASRATKVVKVVQDNQLATAVGLFVLWQLGLVGEAIAYIGC